MKGERNSERNSDKKKGKISRNFEIAIRRKRDGLRDLKTDGPSLPVVAY